jgi:hypothetical protein
MAKTCCLACDKTYSDSLKQCPHCFTTNFFADPDDKVVTAAIYVLVDEMKQEQAKSRDEKLRELQHVRNMLIPRKPWYVRWWRFLTRRSA